MMCKRWTLSLTCLSLMLSIGRTMLKVVWQLKEILEKYFPFSVCIQKEVESLTRFSRYMRDNPQDYWKPIKFEHGLKLDLQSFIGILKNKDHPTLVNNHPLVYQVVSHFVDLICLLMSGLDVILNMDLLFFNHVINYFDKIIFIATQSMSINSSMSNSIIFVVACLKCLVNGTHE
ncbi:hypothetical protein CR513_22854, partial [Mucuna pruriens]